MRFTIKFKALPVFCFAPNYAARARLLVIRFKMIKCAACLCEGNLVL